MEFVSTLGGGWPFRAIPISKKYIKTNSRITIEHHKKISNGGIEK